MEAMEEFREYEDKVLSTFVRQRIQPWQGVSLCPTLQLSIAGGVDCTPFHYLGKDRVKTDRWIGQFSLRGKSYQIVPRVGEKRFRAMLMAAEGLPELATMRASSGVASGEWGRDILALLWTSALDYGRRLHGIIKGYVIREEVDALALRGHLDLYRQLTENELGRKHRIACVYNDLTYDNPINRAILCTIKRLQREGIFPFRKGLGNGSRRSMLFDWLDRLLTLGVSIDDQVIPANRVLWTRNNDGFLRCHELAERLERRGGAKTATSGLDNALLFDSAEVWEIFLFKRMQIVAGNLGSGGLRLRSPRLQNRNIDYLIKYKGIIRGGLMPDYLLEEKGSSSEDWHTIGILDAKCRRLQEARGTWLPDQGEVMQMALYSCNSLNSEKDKEALPCALLYPKVNEKDVPGINAAVLTNGDGLVGHAPLNVTGNPDLSWWLVDLPDPEAKDNNWINKVDEQLKKVLNYLRNPMRLP